MGTQLCRSAIIHVTFLRSWVEFDPYYFLQMFDLSKVPLPTSLCNTNSNFLWRIFQIGETCDRNDFSNLLRHRLDDGLDTLLGLFDRMEDSGLQSPAHFPEEAFDRIQPGARRGQPDQRELLLVEALVDMSRRPIGPKEALRLETVLYLSDEPGETGCLQPRRPSVSQEGIQLNSPLGRGARRVGWDSRKEEIAQAIFIQTFIKKQT